MGGGGGRDSGRPKKKIKKKKPKESLSGMRGAAGVYRKTGARKLAREPVSRLCAPLYSQLPLIPTPPRPCLAPLWSASVSTATQKSLPRPVSPHTPSGARTGRGPVRNRPMFNTPYLNSPLISSLFTVEIGRRSELCKAKESQLSILVLYLD